VGAKQIDLHRLELRFEATRISSAAAVQRLSDSIQTSGQLVACIAAGDQDSTALVLIDGYRRIKALKHLGADTALVQCWHCPVGPALAQMLAHSFSRAFDPMEEALMLRELIDSLGLSQREAARQCARDVSWVQRRLVLLAALPVELVQAVRNAQVSSWAAARILAPLARANSAHASQLLSSMTADSFSTRELQAWFSHYQRAQHTQRQRMVAHPRLFIDSLNERQSQSMAKDLRGGAEREVASELGYLQALLQRVCRRLQALNAPLQTALKGACVRLHATLPEVSNELKRLLP
jgi:ParB-like chromosome segregation protein Spo0J